MELRFGHKKSNWLGAVLSILLAEGAGGIAAWLSGDIQGYYQSLVQPPLSPPAWLFPIAWGILYACMGLAAWLVYSHSMTPKGGKRRALTLYVVQLALNFLWCLVFFRWRLPAASVALILVLDVAVALCLGSFRRVSRPAGRLLLPYLLWLLYATYLTAGIWLLN